MITLIILIVNFRNGREKVNRMEIDIGLVYMFILSMSFGIRINLRKF